jgi:hypothetical protein
MSFNNLGYCQYLLSSPLNYTVTNWLSGQFWVIDYRSYDRDGDGQNKLDHVADMLKAAVNGKSLPFRTVLDYRLTYFIH